MEQIPDAASVAAAHQVSGVLGRRVGPSTGTNVWGAFGLLAEMAAAGCEGSVVTLICDSGDRYADTYFDDAWLAAQGLDPSPYADALTAFEQTCSWPVAATVR
jgi:cysteine synthase A